MHKLLSKVLIVFLGTLLANLGTLWALGLLDLTRLRLGVGVGGNALMAWLDREAYE